eukprot:4864603-Pleurochrysis_carterae.AAC.2
MSSRLRTHAHTLKNTQVAAPRACELSYETPRVRVAGTVARCSGCLRALDVEQPDVLLRAAREVAHGRRAGDDDARREDVRRVAQQPVGHGRAV